MTLDTRRLDALIRAMVADAPSDALAEAVADRVEERWHNIWSGVVPPRSSPFQPPAIDTGALDASIRNEKIGDGKRRVSEGGADAPYAIHLERGTTKMSPRPHVRPVAEQTRKELKSIGASALRVKLKEVIP